MIVTVKTVLKYIGLITVMFCSLSFLIWYIPGPHAQGTLLTMELIIFGPCTLAAIVYLGFAIFTIFGNYLMAIAFKVKICVKKFLEIKLWETKKAQSNNTEKTKESP